MMRKKLCKFCISKTDYIDYKDVKILMNYLRDYKIARREHTGTCLFHQKTLSSAIKYAREVAFLPFVQ